MSLMADLMFNGTADVAVLKAPKIPRPGTYDLRWTGASSYPLVVWRLWRLLRKNNYDAVVGFSLYPAALVRFIHSRERQKFLRKQEIVQRLGLDRARAAGEEAPRPRMRTRVAPRDAKAGVSALWSMRCSVV